jgi:putative exosortase-associated protein (TIGR04073 family)
MATLSSSRCHCLIGCGFVFATLLILQPTSAMAGETVTAHMGQKLLRGVANVTTGIGELPKQIYLQLQRDTIEGVPLGLFDGIGMSVVRVGAGICDISTFMVPLPLKDEPLLKPEFVWERDR